MSNICNNLLINFFFTNVDSVRIMFNNYFKLNSNYPCQEQRIKFDLFLSLACSRDNIFVFFPDKPNSLLERHYGILCKIFGSE